MEIYENYAVYYDSIYPGKNYLSEARLILQELSSFEIPAPSNVLDVGSGTGRHLVEFSLLGLSGFGIEPSRWMVARARERGVVSHHGRVEEFTPVAVFDLAVSLFAVVNHVSPRDLNGFIKAVRNCVKPEGTFGLEMWAPSAEDPGNTVKSFQHEGQTYIRKVSASPIGKKAWRLDIIIQEARSNSVVVEESHEIYRHSFLDIERCAFEVGLIPLSRQPVYLNSSDKFHETYFFAHS